MQAMVEERVVHALEVSKDEFIAAPMEIVFDAILAQMGPENVADGPMPMVLEAWPGGRWFRDLGDGDGHWWGTVQSIRKPRLLEINGPLFMSYPAVSNVQYRLEAEEGGTRLRFKHRAMGLIEGDAHAADQWSHVKEGWDPMIARIRKMVEAR
jgi:uncharacterized protein YndB with AHSA1/START domain